MKKILILGLLLVSHLWGLKKWSGGITDMYYNCDDKWCEGGTPKLPDDYKPQKGDRVIKVKVGSVEGEILCYGNCFIKGDRENTYKYVSSPSMFDTLFINYPSYTVVVDIDSSSTSDWGYANFYQIFAVGDKLEMFKLFDRSNALSCDIENGDSPCPFTKEYILDWIKKQGGQEFFDYACPAYYDKLNSVCSEGVLREPTCQEAKGINPYVDGCED